MTPPDQPAMRIERDSLGELAVPASAYHGIHTARAVANFPLLGQPPCPALVQAMATTKLACARTNRELGFLDATIAGAIIQACRELIAGDLAGEIVVDALQGGAGTSLNMNVNEVLANRAEELLGGARGSYARVHPLDHVNLHQSTNDVFPTAVKVAAISLLRGLEKSIAGLRSSCSR